MDNNALSFVLCSAKQHLKDLSQFKNVCVVIGNETCDLDSAVSSLVYSLLIYNLKTSPESIVIPVFNIPRVQLLIKTEVNYLLKKYGFNLEDFVCRDEIDLESLQNAGSLQLILVDHHVLQQTYLVPSVVAVIDHRPPDPAWSWPNVDVSLGNVGSCCTLVAEKLLSHDPQLVSPMIATWLLGTILLDTACLSPLVGRAKPLDLKISAQLQTYCPQALDKEQLYNELKTAKADITSLTATQLLIKDFKMASFIPIAGLPMKVKDFLQRSDAVDSVHQFCEELNVDVCVVYGQKEVDGNLKRDIAVFGLPHSEAASRVVSALLNCKEPCLKLQSVTCSVHGFTLFEQLNIKASRKQVLPIIQQVADMIKMKK